MFKKIIELEDRLDNLLPARRLTEGPGEELLQAGRAWSEAVWDLAVELGPVFLCDDIFLKAANFSERAIFICGVHRSGTTLVRDLFDSHPALSVLPSEGSYYTSLEYQLNRLPEEERGPYFGKEWLRRLANPINQAPYWLLGRSDMDGSPYVNFARNFLAWWDFAQKNARRKSARPLQALALAYSSQKQAADIQFEHFWVDKTPTNERFLKKIWSEIPAAKIIHIIRDPAAVFASHKKMDPRLNMWLFLRDLKASFKVAVDQSKKKDKNYILIRYEDICNDPDQVLKHLSAFIGIEMLPILFQPTVAGKPTRANSSFDPNLPSGKILNPLEHAKNVTLSNKEQKILAAHIGKLAAKLGYASADLPFWEKAIIKMKHWF